MAATAATCRMHPALLDLLDAIGENKPFGGETTPLQRAELSRGFLPLNPRSQSFFAINIGEVLKTNTSLTYLNLQGQQLGGEVVDGLSPLLARPALATLKLSGNAIGGIAAQKLAAALRENQSLTELELCDPSIGIRGVESLHVSLATNATLRHLTLSSKEEFALAFEGEEMERISSALIEIRKKIVANENSFESKSLSPEEASYRSLVKDVYGKLDARTKGKVEFFVWKGFESPEGDMLFGKKNVFTSWQIFVASTRAAEVDMVHVLSSHCAQLTDINLLELSKWATETFRGTL
ncbi:MAG: hypothetical protein V4492_09085 [Chlamydiota bacterium]